MLLREGALSGSEEAAYSLRRGGLGCLRCGIVALGQSYECAGG